MLVLAGAWGVLALIDRAPTSHRPLPPVATAWLGSATAFASAIAASALHHTTSPGPATSLLLALGAVAGIALGGALLRILIPPKRTRPGSSGSRTDLTSSRAGPLESQATGPLVTDRETKEEVPELQPA